MKFYWVKTSTFIKKCFGGFVWDLPADGKTVYLTFDDGPTPGITPWVLELLERYQAKATFFCIGNNIQKHRELFEQVVEAGHGIGNHTFNHVNGWKTPPETYLEEAQNTEKLITSAYEPFKRNKLFRPPYGKIGRGQARALHGQGYRLIMWDVLSADFDTDISPEKCLQNVVRNVGPGSIIIFHDSIKAFPNLEYALPRVLDFLKKEGYRCAAID